MRGRLLRRHSHGLGDRGAAAIEAAILLPLFLILLFGIIEWGLYMRDSLSVTESARVGVRTASALPRQTGFTQATVDAIAKAGSALPKNQISHIYVYKANIHGYPGPDSNTTMTCSGYAASCDRFVWSSASGKFVLDPSSPPPPWNPTAAIGTQGHVTACPTAASGGPPDSVGVYVEAKHDWATGFFGASRVIQDRAVLSFEPMQIAICK